jgi:Zn-dependent protease with chaperone function
MKALVGHYYDGRSAARTEVTITREGERLKMAGGNLAKSFLVADIRISAEIGRVPRTLRFPDGSQCEVSDSSALDSLLDGWTTGRVPGRLIHRIEKSLPLALLVLFLTVALMTVLVKYGIPALARQAAFAIPPATDAALGSHALETLDRMVSKPSELADGRKQAVTRLFRDVVHDFPDQPGMRLELRSSKSIGANAFALPSGVIVITDGLVNLARHDEEIVGVLAHEAGHLRNRHALRHLLQNSATALVIALVTGDITSATSFSAGLPTALIDAKYSRDFETEADDTAVAYLHRHNIPAHYYADMLRRLEAAHAKKAGEAGKGGKSSVADFFSTHPVTRERIERVMEGR